MMKRGLSVFDPPNDLVDASGVSPKLSEDERVLWIGTPGRLSSFFCATSWVTFGALFLALFVYHGIYQLTPAQQVIADRVIRGRWIVVGMIVVVAFILPLAALRFGGAFAYILTTKRMVVKIDRTRLFVRLFRYFKKVADADGFAAYDLKYLNGARVYVGLWGYGNVSVSYTVGPFGDPNDLSTYKDEPVFFRDRRYVKVFYRKLACFHLAETFCNVYFGIKDVGRLGDVLNDQCAARLGNDTGAPVNKRADRP